MDNSDYKWAQAIGAAIFFGGTVAMTLGSDRPALLAMLTGGVIFTGALIGDWFSQE